MSEFLAAHGLRKSYFKGRRTPGRGLHGRVTGVTRYLNPWRRPASGIEVPVLLGVDLSVSAGEFLSVVGSSGCGKSTLLHLLGTLDVPDEGDVRFGGARIDNLPPAERDRVRNEVFGFIFQFYHLLPEFSALENVLAPLMIRHGVVAYRRAYGRLRADAERLLDRVGLGHRAQHKPSELSGGEMQRTAIARALAGGPQVLLADEPTGNLDAVTGQEIIDLLARLNREEGLTIIMVTHDAGIAERADRCVRLVNGQVAEVAAVG